MYPLTKHTPIVTHTGFNYQHLDHLVLDVVKTNVKKIIDVVHIVPGKNHIWGPNVTLSRDQVAATEQELIQLIENHLRTQKTIPIDEQQLIDRQIMLYVNTSEAHLKFAHLSVFVMRKNPDYLPKASKSDVQYTDGFAYINLNQGKGSANTLFSIQDTARYVASRFQLPSTLT